MTRGQTKIANSMALLLIILINCAYVDSLNLRAQTKWTSKYWMQAKDGLVMIYKDIEACYKSCPTMDCQRTNKWEDTALHLSQEDYYFCLIVKTPIRKNKISLGRKKFYYRDLCDSYCQPVEGKRCRKAKVCLDTKCVNNANRYLC